MIEAASFLAAFLIMPVIWVYMLSHASINLFRISIPGILILSIFIFQYIGFPIIFFEVDDLRALTIHDQKIIWKIFAGSVVTITLLIAGFILGRRFFGPLHSELCTTSLSADDRAANVSDRLFVTIFVIAAIIGLIFYIKIVELPNVALLAALGLVDTDHSIHVLRSAMGNSFPGKYHWYKFVMRDCLQIATLALFADYLISKNRYVLLFFLISFLLILFSTTMTTEKAPVLWFFVSMVMMFCIVRRDRYIPKRIIFLSFLFLVFALIVVYFFFSDFQDDSFKFGAERAISRILTGQMSGLYHYVEIFPEQIDFLNGRSLPNPGGIFPWEPYRLSFEVQNIVNPNFKDRGIIGSMPTFFWGQMYANFGYLGVLLPPAIIGFFLYFLDRFLLQLPQSPLNLSFFIWFTLHYRLLTATGLGAFIIDANFIIVMSALGLSLFLRLGPVMLFPGYWKRVISDLRSS